MSDSARIATWLAAQATASNRGRLVRLELRHLTIGSEAGHEVTIEEAPEAPDGAWAQALAERLYSDAAADASAIAQGTQRYAVVSVREKGPGARIIFAVDQAETTDTMGWRSEPATAAGALAQSMRHIEAKERAVTALMSVLLTETTARVTTLAKENARLRAEHERGAQLVEELVCQRQRHELEAEKERAKVDLLQQAAGELKTLLPAIVGRVAGKVSPEAAAAAQDRATRGFVASLTPEQRDKLTAAVTPLMGELTTAQQVALAEIFSQRDPN